MRWRESRRLHRVGEIRPLHEGLPPSTPPLERVTESAIGTNLSHMITRIMPLALVALAAMAITPLRAAPPQVGQEAPDFQLRAIGGKEVRFADLVKQATAVLIVLRGYPGYQCPICNRQVQEFLSNAKAFSEAGAQVVMVYPGPPDRLDERAAEFAAGKKFPENFFLLLDPDYRFTNLYSLRWDAPRETAYPSTFIVGGDRKVRFAKVSTTHGGRSSAAEVLAILKTK